MSPPKQSQPLTPNKAPHHTQEQEIPQKGRNVFAIAGNKRRYQGNECETNPEPWIQPAKEPVRP